MFGDQSAVIVSGQGFSSNIDHKPLLLHIVRRYSVQVKYAKTGASAHRTRIFKSLHGLRSFLICPLQSMYS
jgi:hypothetical protein